jgi:hypothetical protein
MNKSEAEKGEKKDQEEINKKFEFGATGVKKLLLVAFHDAFLHEACFSFILFS